MTFFHIYSVTIMFLFTLRMAIKMAEIAGKEGFLSEEFLSFVPVFLSMAIILNVLIYKL